MMSWERDEAEAVEAGAALASWVEGANSFPDFASER